MLRKVSIMHMNAIRACSQQHKMASLINVKHGAVAIQPAGSVHIIRPVLFRIIPHIPLDVPSADLHIRT